MIITIMYVPKVRLPNLLHVAHLPVHRGETCSLTARHLPCCQAQGDFVSKANPYIVTLSHSFFFKLGLINVSLINKPKGP